MAYCVDSDVAALVGNRTNGGMFDDNTQPTLDQVNSWINQVSAIADVAFAAEGFTVPITNATVISVLQLYVAAAVADLVQYTNSAGRFFAEQQLQSTRNPIAVITSELKTFATNLAAGLENVGGDRSQPLTDGLDFRSYDEAGNYLFPLFQRNFANWKGRDVYADYRD